MKATRRIVERKDMFGPVLASIGINKDAEEKVNEETGEKYLACWKSVPGGFVELFIYGDTTSGRSVPAMVKARAKLVNNQWVPYLRADVAANEHPTHTLFVGSPTEIDKLDLSLPSMVSNETFVKEGQDVVRCSLIGFKKIVAKV